MTGAAVRALLADRLEENTDHVAGAEWCRELEAIARLYSESLLGHAHMVRDVVTRRRFRHLSALCAPTATIGEILVAQRRANGWARAAMRRFRIGRLYLGIASAAEDAAQRHEAALLEAWPARRVPGVQ